MRTIKIIIEEVDPRHMKMDIDFGKDEDGTKDEAEAVQGVRGFLEAHARWRNAVIGAGNTLEEAHVSAKTYLDILEAGKKGEQNG